MATVIDLSGLTFNPKDVDSFGKMIFEDVMKRPKLTEVHEIIEGVIFNEKILYASLLSKTGLKAGTDCNIRTSGAQSRVSEKLWTPVGIEDTLIQCTKQMNPLFKAYKSTIKEYREEYKIKKWDAKWITINQDNLSTDDVTDIATFLVILFAESMLATVWRAAWFGDTAVAAANSSTSGTISTTNETAAEKIKFYNYFDGLFKQAFTGVANSTIQQIVIPENANTTDVTTQLTLEDGRGLEILKTLKSKAGAGIKSDAEVSYKVSGEIFDNIENSLITMGASYNIDIVQNGLPTLKYLGANIIDMRTIWDTVSREDFANDTTDNVYNLPHRAVLCSKKIIPIATLNSGDFSKIEVFYNNDTQEHKERYGFSLDAKIVKDDLFIIAY